MLMRNRSGNFSMSRLIDFLTALGQDVQITVGAKSRTQPAPTYARYRLLLATRFLSPLFFGAALCLGFCCTGSRWYVYHLLPTQFFAELL
jgi:hypothetical protein